MLTYEREVVDALIGTDSPEVRAAVADHVDKALAAMPETIRLGVRVESLGLGAWSALRRRGGPVDADDELAWLDANPVGLVQQWVRLLRSLVLFAENELIVASGVSAA